MKKKVLVVAFIILLALAVLTAGFLYKNRNIDREKTQQLKDAMEKTGEMEIDTLFLSMFPVGNYNEEILYTCLLAEAEILPVSLESGEQMVGVLEEVLSQPHNLSRIFLGIYKESILEEGTEGSLPEYKSELMEQGYSWEEAILELGKAHPEITFEILLYYPSIGYWTSMEEAQVEQYLDWYAYAGELYSHHDVVQNVRPYMPGCEEWLICNESNYQDVYRVTETVANELERLVFCDLETIMVPNSVQEQCDRLRNLIHQYKEENREYGTEAGWTYVFVGDSVIGNYTGSLSIPGVVHFMTGADAVNCGYGGLAAAKADEQDLGLGGVLDCLLSTVQDRSVAHLENENVRNGITQFWEKNIKAEEEKLVFFISFGINDYSVGRPVYNETMDELCYVGALTQAVERLQEGYPNAEIVLMTPNYIEMFEHGTMDNSGVGYVFEDYVQAVLDLAAEENLQVIDIYHHLGMNGENAGKYLADGCHPNYFGRYKIGEIIWKFMQ